MDQLTNYFHLMDVENNISFFAYTLIILCSLLSSVQLAFIYAQVSGQKLFPETGIQRTLPILGLATTAIFCTLQFSVPLSLGLLGSLSIVRFRSPIKNSIDVSFILLIIANSLLASTSNFVLAIILNILVHLIIVYVYNKKTITNAFEEGTKVMLSMQTEREYFLKSEAAIIEKLRATCGKNVKVKSITSDGNSIFLHCSVVIPPQFDFSKVHSILPEGSVINLFYE